MSENGKVEVEIQDGIATLCFSHPKKNSLPGSLLSEIAQKFDEVGKISEAKVIVMTSGDRGPFCAGASFDELLAIDDFEKGKEFFMGFARVILAMKKCPKLIIGKIQGKVVGGGVGLACACDYAFASNRASIKLSELALGIGPFVIGPVVERKVGPGPFSILAIDADWHDASWAKNFGIYADVFDTGEELDNAIKALAQKLSKSSPEAMAELKKVFWENTGHWQELLEKRAEISGKLVLSEYTSKAIEAFKKK